MKSKWKLIIFDGDGVLVDSESISCGVVAQMSTEMGHPMSAKEGLETFAGTSLQFVETFIEQKTNKKIPYSFEDVYRERTYELFKTDLQAVAGVKAALEQIDLPKCVASNGPLEKVKSNLNITRLSVHFLEQHLFSAYQVQRWKPDPALFLHAAQQLGVAPNDCIVVEDSTHGVEAALAAGMDVLGFPGSTTAQELKKAGAQVLDSMASLPTIIYDRY